MADVSSSAASGSHDPRHAPVLRAEAIEALAPERGGAFIDGTYGAGGYSATLLGGGAGFVLGIDRDPDAVAEANADIAASNGGCALCRVVSATLKPWPLTMTPAQQTASPLIPEIGRAHV